MAASFPFPPQGIPRKTAGKPGGEPDLQSDTIQQNPWGLIPLIDESNQRG
ncbi:hypothetical protein IQ258_14680 [Coleofasciculus sp. LEGE 07081]|nr:hypothetical protein [Coleofasciculus sp. LEGE 07081]